MLNRISITGLFILLIVQLCYSQRATSLKYLHSIEDQNTNQKILPAVDELDIELRLPAEEKIDKYKNDPDFNYDPNQAKAEDWITKIKNWINQQLSTIVSSETYWTVLDYIYYGLMIIALILIIRGLLKADRRGLIFGKLNTQSIYITENEEDLSSMDFDDLIRSAIEIKNYKLAIRYLYLKSLHLLANQNIIELRSNKTNYQYLSEIKNTHIASTFRNTTRFFEYVWYGEFPVDEIKFKLSQNEFNELFGFITAK